MRTFSDFLLEAKSKSINELMFYFKMRLAKGENITFSSSKDLYSFYKESLIYAIKQVYPKIFYISNEENENLLGHLLKTTKDRNIAIENPEDYVTRHRLYSPEKYSYSLEFNHNEIKFQTGTYSVDPNFNDEDIVYNVFEEIKDFLVEVLSFLSNRPDKIKVTHNQEKSELGSIPDFFKIYAPMSYRIQINDVNFFLFNIPKSVKEISGSLNLSRKNLSSLPDYLPDVGGNFFCEDNYLKSLKGSPRIVKSEFNCSKNKTLKSLLGCPSEVLGDFICNFTGITSLSGASKMKIGRNFEIIGNEILASLSGCPKEIKRSFYCNNNYLLKNLLGGPRKVGGIYDCSDNALISLEGAPKEVPDDFKCSANNLTDLMGSPKKVGGDFICSKNNLKTLDGCPKEIGGDFVCLGKDKEFSEEDIRKICNVKGRVLLD